MNAQREFEQVYSALKSSELPIALIPLNPPTLLGLQAKLLSNSFDVVHFICHGNEEGLWMENERCQSDFVASEELAACIRQGELPLVILNTSESWGPAQALVDAGVRSVIAWKKPIDDGLYASTVAHVLYSALANARTIQEAVDAAQMQLNRNSNKPNKNAIVDYRDNIGKSVSTFIRSTGAWRLGPPKAPFHNIELNLIDRFVNRWHELTGPIYDFLSNPDYRAVALVGLGGIGKSSLAVAAAWRYAWELPDGILRITIHDNPSLMSAKS